MIEAPEWAVFEYRLERHRYWCEMVRYEPRRWLKPKRIVVERLWEDIQEVNGSNIEQTQYSLKWSVLKLYGNRLAVKRSLNND